jgi:hypothetical protein
MKRAYGLQADMVRSDVIVRSPRLAATDDAGPLRTFRIDRFRAIRRLIELSQWFWSTSGASLGDAVLGGCQMC